MSFNDASLEARLQRAVALLPPSHRLPPRPGDLFSSWEEGKTCLQNYAFTQGFALVTETNDKKNHIVKLDCSRHHKRERNTRKIEESDCIQTNTKVLFNDCKFRFTMKKNKDSDTWRLLITNPEHNHEMAVDPFTFKEHLEKDPDRANALEIGKTLCDSATSYGQASRALRIHGLRLSRSAFYNLARSAGAHTPEQELKLALGILKDEGFHVRCSEKYIVENNIRQRRVVEHFFFCNQEQIRLARRFVSGFAIQTDATFNTNQLNLPLSTLVGVTNTGQTFPVAYCFITSESAECFSFLFYCMKDLIFHDKCPGPGVILGDFAAGLGAAMQNKKSRSSEDDAVMFTAWEAAQAIESNCILQLCAWHAAEAIKKRLIKTGAYPVEIRQNLDDLIWSWIQSPTMEQLEERRTLLLYQLHASEQVRNFFIMFLKP